jgi:hypothetical protein
MLRMKQRKPTSRELIRTLTDKCGLSESKQTDNVLNRQQLAELVLHIDNQAQRILDLQVEGQPDAEATPE